MASCSGRLTHGYEFKTNPVLEPLDCIECRDALLRFTPETLTVRAEPVEADWPKASVVVGNPPFLGGSKKRGELGVEYFTALNSVYKDVVPGFRDLICYWFAKSLKAIETNGLGAAGLVSTNSIRGGANRKVLEAIVERSHIFEAWSDEVWVNEGAAVRVSLICFGHADGSLLNGQEVSAIDASLTSTVGFDASKVQQLTESAGTAFEGTKKYGTFEIEGKLAREWLRQPNPHGISNASVVRPWSNGMDITKRPLDYWIVDFGVTATEAEAALFELPFQHAVRYVKDTRTDVKWWLHERPRPNLRKALTGLSRCILTVRVSKYRFFVWRSGSSIPDTATVAIARSDDATFGILHSRFHEAWSLRMGTSLGVGNDPRYTPTTCFETFPFPAGLTPQDTASQQTRTLASGAVVPDLKASTGSARTMGESIAKAAHKLTTLRDNWLNPPDWTQRLPEVVPLGMSASPYPGRIIAKAGHEKELSERTLTKLYNARPAWLDSAHKTLDQAVATAYGWTDYTAEMADEVILQRLLVLNVERSVVRGAATPSLAPPLLKKGNFEGI